MKDALDARQRASLERLVTEARRILERDLASQAAGRYGIDTDGTVAAEEDLRLDATALVHRHEIVEVIDHLRSEGAAPRAVVARLLRETVFTHLNRLVAIRIAETQGLLPPSLAAGRSSQGFRDLLEAVPLLASDDTGGYWAYLQICGDELAADMSTLFDPRNPLLALAPSPGSLAELTRLLSDPARTEIWAAPDCLGWVYQFFNTRDERMAMREASTAPRTSRELAVRNQFFTPRYVVDFLVQNSLGRRLMDADPDSPLLADLPLLIDPPTAKGHAADLQEVTVLDPACGSGHFLLAAYDVLERAWHHQGVSPRDAASAIVQSLWGIDIDPRCAQVAAAAVVFRARRYCLDGDLPRPNITCARSLPSTATGLEQMLRSLPQSQRSLIERLTETLVDAPILGSLLKVEETLAAEIKATMIGGPALPGTLADSLSAESIQKMEDNLLVDLSGLARATTATPAERLLAAEADDAIRYVQALQRRYDAVLMNPPFGEPVPETKSYLKTAYPWIPWKDNNLLAAFVGRGRELCKPGGFVGAITSRAGLFLTTFEAWRREVLLSHQLVTLADLGAKVMEGAQVEACAYVLGARSREVGEQTAFISLLRDTNRAAALTEACRHTREGIPSSRVYQVAPEELEAIPGAPLAYWVAPSIRRLFTEYPPIEGNGAETRVGLQTGDDFRFVRTFWEVSPDSIARNREETLRGLRWVPFAKGGEYSPYYSDIHLLVNWDEDGRRIREFEKSIIRNARYYFRQGLTWPERTVSGFGPQVMPVGTIISVKGPGIFPADNDSIPVLAGIFNSRLMRCLVDGLVPAGEATESGGVPARDYGVGLVQRLPWLGSKFVGATGVRYRGLAREMVALRASLDASAETTHGFVCPAVFQERGDSLAARIHGALCSREAAVLHVLECSLDVERLLHSAVNLESDAETFLDQEQGPHPASYVKTALSAEEERELARLYQMPIDRLVDEVLGIRGGSRTIATKSYVVDRRVEILAHVFDRHPQVIVEARRQLGLQPPEEPERSCEDLISYLVGCAFGRWDVRTARDPSRASAEFDPLEPLPVSSPGMLVGPDRRPIKQPHVGYPLELPDAGFLLDEEGHQLDLVRRVGDAADTLFEDSDSVLEECRKVLGRELRDYVRRHFFKAHLGRYSKSRRKAPIYWPLFVPSATWGVWVYAPMLSREILFAITRAAADRLDAAEAGIRRLRLERQAGGAGRSARQVAAALESEERLASELVRFRDEAERIAGLGWEPDLDDGIILCAAPLAEIFPAWREAAAARDEIRSGKYPWARVSRWAGKL